MRFSLLGAAVAVAFTVSVAPVTHSYASDRPSDICNVWNATEIIRGNVYAYVNVYPDDKGVDTYVYVGHRNDPDLGEFLCYRIRTRQSYAGGAIEIGGTDAGTTVSVDEVDAGCGTVVADFAVGDPNLPPAYIPTKVSYSADSTVTLCVDVAGFYRRVVLDPAGTPGVSGITHHADDVPALGNYNFYDEYATRNPPRVTGSASSRCDDLSASYYETFPMGVQMLVLGSPIYVHVARDHSISAQLVCFRVGDYGGRVEISDGYVRDAADVIGMGSCPVQLLNMTSPTRLYVAVGSDSSGRTGLCLATAAGTLSLGTTAGSSRPLPGVQLLLDS